MNHAQDATLILIHHRMNCRRLFLLYIKTHQYTGYLHYVNQLGYALHIRAEELV